MAPRNRDPGAETSECKEAEAAVEKRRVFQEAVLDCIADGIVACDREGTLTYFNRATLELHGLPLEPIEPEEWASHYDLYEPDGKTPLTRERVPLFRALKGEDVSGQEMVVAAKGRPARTLIATGRKLTDSDGNPLGAVVSMHDITESKQAEDALRESEEATRQSEERCRALSEASFEAIFFSEKGVCIEQNATAEKMFGYTLAEAVGRKGTEWIAAEDRETVMNNMLSGHEGRYEVTALRKDGSTFPAEIQARMMQYQGRTVRVTTLSDVTERKKAEAALTESENRFRTLVTNTEEIVYVIARDGTFLLSEGKGLSSLGLKPGEVVGRSVFDLYRDYPDMLDTMRRALDGDSVIAEVDVGSSCFKSWYAPYRNQENEIIGLLGYSINITEQKEAQERERRYQERLKALAFELTLSEERERRRLAVDLHDHAGQSLALARIRLAAVKKTAGDAGLAARLDEVSQALLEAVRETQNVVHELGSPSMHELGLDAAISEWLEDRIASRHGLKTEFTADKLNTRLGDDTQAILFRNVKELLTNVVKHARAKEVSVRMKNEGDTLRIVVEDDGVGFDPHAVAHTRNGEGGFGLFSIRERMGDLGGSLEIESDPGLGCAAALVIPHPSHDPGGKA